MSESYKIHDLESHITNGVTINNSLNVTGTSTLNTLNVSGNSNISSLEVSGTAQVNTLNVTGNADIKGNINFTGTLKKNGSTYPGPFLHSKIFIHPGTTTSHYTYQNVRLKYNNNSGTYSHNFEWNNANLSTTGSTNVNDMTKLVFTEAGYYRIYASARPLNNNNGSYRYLFIQKNGSTLVLNRDINGVVGLHARVTEYFQANDYITMNIFQDTGGNLGFIENVTFIEITRVG